MMKVSSSVSLDPGRLTLKEPSQSVKQECSQSDTKAEEDGASVVSTSAATASTPPDSVKLEARALKRRRKTPVPGAE